MALKDKFMTTDGKTQAYIPVHIASWKLRNGELPHVQPGIELQYYTQEGYRANVGTETRGDATVWFELTCFDCDKLTPANDTAAPAKGTLQMDKITSVTAVVHPDLLHPETKIVTEELQPQTKPTYQGLQEVLNANDIAQELYDCAQARGDAQVHDALNAQDPESPAVIGARVLYSPMPYRGPLQFNPAELTAANLQGILFADVTKMDVPMQITHGVIVSIAQYAELDAVECVDAFVKALASHGELQGFHFSTANEWQLEKYYEEAIDYINNEREFPSHDEDDLFQSHADLLQSPNPYLQRYALEKIFEESVVNMIDACHEAGHHPMAVARFSAVTAEIGNIVAEARESDADVHAYGDNEIGDDNEEPV